MDNYTLWVDEFGHFPNTLGHASRKPNKATRPHDIKEQYFTLLGVAIHKEAHGHIVHRSLENLKKNHFPEWVDNGVILHRYDIENFKGPFNALKKDKEKARSFYNAISAFLQEQKYYIMAVTIDKETFTLSHKPTPDVIVECLSALLSCYCGFLNFTHCRGKVTAEQIGRREEKALGDAYQLIYNNGIPILSVDEVRQALTSKKLHIKPKSQNIAGLQIADLLAHPVTQEILQENNRSVPSISDFNKLILAATSAKYNIKQKHNRLYCYGRFLIT